MNRNEEYAWMERYREREKRKPDEGPTEWASHYLNSLQILNARGGVGWGGGSTYIALKTVT